MKAFLLATNEKSSSRFERLLDHLDLHEKDDVYRVLGHLVQWYSRWCGDQEFDHGLFWDITIKRLGMWADWADPQVFGNALVKAGYVSDIAGVYPAELLRGRSGFVARTPSSGVALDESYRTVHGRQPERALELAFYLSDPQRRASSLALAGCAGLPAWVPAGWVPGFDVSAPVVGADLVAAPVVGAAVVAAPAGAVPLRADCARIARRLCADSLPAPTAPNVNVNVTTVRKDLENHVIRTNPSTGDGRQRTGKPKSDEMGATIREHKYSNPLQALCATDDSVNAVELWTAIVEKDLDFIRNELGKAVETDERWAQIGNPAGWFMSLVSKRLKTLGKSARNGRR
jgi:hypothetical protein